MITITYVASYYSYIVILWDFIVSAIVIANDVHNSYSYIASYIVTDSCMGI